MATGKKTGGRDRQIGDPPLNPDGRPVVEVYKNGVPVAPSQYSIEFNTEYAILARKKAKRLLNRLAHIGLTSTNETAAVNAIREINRRSMGESAQTLSISGNVTHTFVDELRRLGARLDQPIGGTVIDATIVDVPPTAPTEPPTAPTKGDE